MASSQIHAIQPGVSTSMKSTPSNAMLGAGDVPAWLFNPHAITAAGDIAQIPVPFNALTAPNRQDPISIYDYMPQFGPDTINKVATIKQMEDNINFMAFMADGWINEIMPLDLNSIFKDSINIATRVHVNYRPAMPTYVPEFTTGKRLPKSSYTTAAGIERYGFAMQFEHGFMHTMTGARNYVLEQIQMAGSMGQFMMIEALNALVKCHTTEAMQQLRRKQVGEPNMENLAAMQGRHWDCIRLPRGLTHLQTEVHAQMQQNGGAATNTVILPIAAQMYMKRDPSYTDYWLAGPSGQQLLRNTVLMGMPYMPGSAIEAYKNTYPEGPRGMSSIPVGKLLGNTIDVFNSSPFIMGDGNTIDSLSRETEMGLYTPMLDEQQFGTPASSAYSSHQRMVGINDFDARDTVKFTLMQAWEAIKEQRFIDGLPRALSNNPADYPANVPGFQDDVHSFVENGQRRTTFMYGDMMPQYFNDEALERLAYKASMQFVPSATVKDPAGAFRRGIDLLKRIDNVGLDESAEIIGELSGIKTTQIRTGIVPVKEFITKDSTGIYGLDDAKYTSLPPGYVSYAGIKELASLDPVKAAKLADDIKTAKDFLSVIDDLVSLGERVFPKSLGLDKNMASDIWPNPTQATTLVELLVGVRTPLLMAPRGSAAKTTVAKKLSGDEMGPAVIKPILDRFRGVVSNTLFGTSDTAKVTVEALKSAAEAKEDQSAAVEILGGLLGKCLTDKTPKKVAFAAPGAFTAIATLAGPLFGALAIAKSSDLLTPDSDMRKTIWTTFMKLIILAIINPAKVPTPFALADLEKFAKEVAAYTITSESDVVSPALTICNKYPALFLQNNNRPIDLKSRLMSGAKILSEELKRIVDVYKADGDDITPKDATSTVLNLSDYVPTRLLASPNLIRQIYEKYKNGDQVPLWPSRPTATYLPMFPGDLEKQMQTEPMLHSALDIRAASSLAQNMYSRMLPFIGQAARISSALQMLSGSDISSDTSYGISAGFTTAPTYSGDLQYADVAKYVGTDKPSESNEAMSFYQGLANNYRLAGALSERDQVVMAAAANLSTNFKTRFATVVTSPMGILQQLMAKLFLLTPITFESGKALIANNVTLPYSFILARPHGRYTTHSTIFTEKNVGNLLLARGRLTMGDDARLQYHVASFTFEAGTVINKPMSLYVALHSIVTRYHGNMGTDIISVNDNYRPGASSYGGSMYVLMLPYNTSMAKKHTLLMTGIPHGLQLDKEYQISQQTTEPSYETAAFTNAHFGLYGSVTGHQFDDQVHEGGVISPGANMVCTEEPRVLYNCDGEPSTVKPGCYVWTGLIGSHCIGFLRGESGEYPAKLHGLKPVH